MLQRVKTHLQLLRRNFSIDYLCNFSPLQLDNKMKGCLTAYWSLRSLLRGGQLRRGVLQLRRGVLCLVVGVFPPNYVILSLIWKLLSYPRKLVWINLEIAYIFYKGPSFSSFHALVYQALRRLDGFAEVTQSCLNVSTLKRSLIPIGVGALWMLQPVNGSRGTRGGL